MKLSNIKKIYDLNDIVEKHNHTIGQIDVSLGVSPEVTAHLNSKDSRSFSSDSLTETEREKLTDDQEPLKLRNED